MAAPNIVNVTSIFGKTMGDELTVTPDTDILTCPSEKVLKINSILITNIDGSVSSDATINFRDSSAATTYKILFSTSVPAGSQLIALSKEAPIYLEEGDKIQGSATSAGDLSVIISYEELDDA